MKKEVKERRQMVIIPEVDSEECSCNKHTIWSDAGDCMYTVTKPVRKGELVILEDTGRFDRQCLEYCLPIDFMQPGEYETYRIWKVI